VAAEIPTFEPAEIIIGETVKWRISFTGYSPVDGWALTYYLRGAGAGFNLTEDDCIAVDGTGWLVTIPAVTTTPEGEDPPPPGPATDQLTAGDYYREAWVEKADEKYRVSSGKTIAKQSLATVETDEAYDGRSAVKKTLDAIRAAIAGRATAAEQSRTVANTTIQFMTMQDLMIAETRWQQLYNQEVRRARAARGESAFRMVRTRFVRPS
jgi:hypothetical protein